MTDKFPMVRSDNVQALPTYEYTYSSNTTGANFNTQLQTVGWNGVETAILIIIVNASIELTSGTQTGSVPAGCALSLQCEGTIRGTNCNGDDGLSLGHDITATGSGDIKGGGGSGGSGGSSGPCGQTCVPDGEQGTTCYPAPPSPGSPGACGDYGDAGATGGTGGCGGSPGGPGGAAGYAVRENGYSFTNASGGSLTTDGTVG